jgi:hypothetical protein
VKSKDLIIDLLKHPLDVQVVIRSGDTAAPYPLWGKVTVGCYIAENEHDGEFYEHTGIHGPDIKDGCVPAICLEPMS